MWRFLDGAQPPKSPNVSKEKRQEYEANRKRNFRPAWKVGRVWLRDTVDGMKCQYCSDFECQLSGKGFLKHSRAFIDGCRSFKLESIIHHERSAAHQFANDCATSKVSASAPANTALSMLHSQHSEKMKILFQNVHALAKHGKPFSDYNWLCDLDEKKGLSVGDTYRNTFACRTFTNHIAQSAVEEFKQQLDEIRFISISVDGATDCSIIEQQIVFIRFCQKGQIVVKFAGIKNPESPDAKGIFHTVMQILSEMSLSEEALKKKLVGFACDGASVMLGSRGGVSALLKKVQPCLVTIHCLAHRLELAYKDCVKKDKLYESCVVLLMGLYYFYHNSPKQRQNLRRSFELLGSLPAIPTRVAGTRWVAHMVLAIENFLRGYKAIMAQLEDCVADKQSSGLKARGYLKLMKQPAVVAYICTVLDVLKPLKSLSLALQSNHTTLADVHEKLQVTKDILSNYSESDGPKLASFMNEVELCNSYQGQSMVPSRQAVTKQKEILVSNLIKALDNRFLDVHEGLVAATQVANFTHWPVQDRKDEIKGFGNEEISTLSTHFAAVLQAHGLDTDEIKLEWTFLKSHLYNRFKAKVQALTWLEVHASFPADFPNVLALMDLVMTLPSSSAENERGFSKMRSLKTVYRNKLKTQMLSNLMAINLNTSDISEYNPDSAVMNWVKSAKRSRRPGFLDERGWKRGRVSVNEEVRMSADEERMDVVDLQRESESESEFESEFESDHEVSERYCIDFQFVDTNVNDDI